MNIEINKILLGKIRDYLIKSQWVNLDIQTELPITIWTKKDFQEKIRLPTDTDLIDIHRAIHSILEILSRSESEDIEVIYKLITQENPIKNDISIRVCGEDILDGKIPLTDGAILFLSTNNLMKSLAKNIFKYFKAKDRRVMINEFMSQTKLGQTAVGSYIVNIDLPPLDFIKNEANEEVIELKNDLSFNEQIHKSLASLKLAIDKYKITDDILEFREAKSNVVNAQICQSLLNMSGVGRRREIEINCRISHSTKNRKIYFNSSEIEIMGKAYNYLTDKEYFLENTTITGYVTNLSQAQFMTDGKVIIDAYFENRSIKIDTTLSEENYRQAINAHRDRIAVECSGNILFRRDKGQNKAQITELIGFRLLPQEKI